MKIIDVIRTSDGGLWIIPPLEELATRGHDVSVILPDPYGRLGQALTEKGIKAIRSKAPLGSGRDALNPVGLAVLRRQILQLEPDIVFYQLIQTALAVRLALAGTKIRRVHQVPGPLYLESRRIRSAERFLARLDDAIICGTDYTLSKYREIGYPRDRLFSVPFGAAIGEGPQPGEKTDLREKWGIPPDAFTVVMVAYYYPPRTTVFKGRGIKGHEDLLEAWIPFGREHPDARLLLVGEGWGPAGDNYYRSVRNRFEDLVAPGSVLWIEGQRDSRPFYAMADLSVSPSLSEGHGAALEAGAMAVPSIVSNAGGLPETVDVGRSGWIFSAGSTDELLCRLEDSYRAFLAQRLRDMGLAAREIVYRRFRSSDCARHVADILESVGNV